MSKLDSDSPTPAPSDDKVDCHYCEYALCHSEDGYVDCYVDDEAYFDHHVQNSKKEAEECLMFSYCDIFPKY